MHDNGNNDDDVAEQCEDDHDASGRCCTTFTTVLFPNKLQCGAPPDREMQRYAPKALALLAQLSELLATVRLACLQV